MRSGSCSRVHRSRTFVSGVLSLQALWHTVRDWHTDGVSVYPALPKQRATECLSPPGTVKVLFSVPVEFFSASVRKHGIIDYTPMRAISITYMQKPDTPKGFFPKMDLRPRIHAKCQTPSGKQAFAIANLPAFPSLTPQNIQ